MADKKISELTAHTAPIDADTLAIVDSTAGSTKKMTWEVLADKILEKNETATWNEIREKLTHYTPLFWRGTYSGEVKLTQNNSRDSYRDFALWHVVVSGIMYYRYITRNSDDEFYMEGGKADGDVRSFASISLAGIYAIVPLGDYAYAFGGEAGAVTVRRFTAKTNTGTPSLTTMTIGAGGNTPTVGRVLFSDTYVFITTTTANTWNKYSISGTDLVYEATVSLTTGTQASDIGLGHWCYIPGTAPEEWIYANVESQGGYNYDQVRKYIAGTVNSQYAYFDYPIWPKTVSATISVYCRPIFSYRVSCLEMIALNELDYYDGGSVRRKVLEATFYPCSDLPTFS